MSDFDTKKILGEFDAAKKSTPKPAWRQMQLMEAAGSAVSVFMLSFVFLHYCPDGLPVAGFAVRWWMLPVAGFVAGCLLPRDKLPFPLPLTIMVMQPWAWILTVLLWGVMALYNAIVPEAYECGLWLAPLIGFGITIALSIPYALAKKAGEHTARL
jgi:hypothetical protein